MLNGSVAVTGMLAAQCQQLLERDPELAEVGADLRHVLLDERRRKRIEAGRHGRVGREHVAGTGGAEGVPERHVALFPEAAGAFQHEEGGVPLVEVTDVDLQLHRLERSPAADPEDDLLHEAQLVISPVQLAGDPAVHRTVHRVVAIQQIQRHAPHLRAPHAQEDRPSGKIERDMQPSAAPRLDRLDRQAGRLVVRVHLALPAPASMI